MAAPNFCDGKCHIKGGDHRPAQVARTGRVPGCNTLNTKLECENAWACNYGNMDDIDGEITCNLPYGASCHWNGRSCALAGAGSSVIHNCGRSVDDDVCKEKKCNGVERDTICGRHPSGTKVSENECDELYTTSGISEAGKAYQCVWSRRGTGSCDAYLTSSSNITGWEANSKDNNKCIIPVDCVGTWGDWGDCSADCGGGTQTRVYSISTPAFKGGSECPSPETQDCNTQACPVNCVGGWGVGWTPNPCPCSPSIQTRTYSISTDAEYGGIECEAVHDYIDERNCPESEYPSTCDRDCNNIWGGSDEVDLCGDCGGDGSSCADCAGTPNGSAAFDDCGVCGGDNSSCLGCDRLPNSGLVNDVCGVCGGDGTSCADCAGTSNGPAVVDECGVCGGNNYYTMVNREARGLTWPIRSGYPCGCADGDGNQASMDDYGGCCLLTEQDCRGECGGPAVLDICGVCGGDGTSCADCAGTPNGSAVVDECGVCGGNNYYTRVNREARGLTWPIRSGYPCGCADGDGNQASMDDYGGCCLLTEQDCRGECGGPVVLDICGVCGGGSSNCSDCWSPCDATYFIEEVPTAICENAEDRIWDPPRDTGVPLPPQNTECIPEDCGAGQGNCPFKCQGTWGVCDGGNCLQDQCDSDCNEEFYYLPSPPPPAPPMEHGTCGQPAGTKRYCQTGANNCPLPADCTYEPVMGECYGCNFDSSGNFISSSDGMERQEYRIRTPIYGDMNCTHSGSDIPLEDKDPYVTMDSGGNYTLLMENPCSDPNPSCTSCKPLNQLFQEEGVSTKEELCNNVFLDIRRLNCTPDGITIDSYNTNNMDGLKKFTNINKGGDENYDIFERDTFDPQKYILKNKSMGCFHNIFEGSGTLCDNIFLPDNTLGGLKYVHNLNDCIDDNINDWSNILTRSDPYLNQGNWFNLDQEEISGTP